MPKENFILCLAAINPAMITPLNVPIAYAKKGETKYFKDKSGMMAAKASISLGSMP